MKIKIAYTEAEKERAEDLAALYIKKMQKYSAVTFNFSKDHEPFLHIYIADGHNNKHSKKQNKKP